MSENLNKIIAQYGTVKGKLIDTTRPVERRDGHIVIQKERHGWRILPEAEHLNAHRALRKSAKGVY